MHDRYTEKGVGEIDSKLKAKVKWPMHLIQHPSILLTGLVGILRRVHRAAHSRAHAGPHDLHLHSPQRRGCLQPAHTGS